jgi:DNA-binding response OmpR family regulator
MTRLLVIEDEPKLLRSLHRGLEEEGYTVLAAVDGVDGFRRASSAQVDAVILDLMLPGRDGLSLLRELRERDGSLPVLIVTARDAVADRIIGLDSGADDYLVKPFAFAELLARLRALVRRGRPSDAQRLSVADLEVDRISRQVTRGGRPLDLTVREFELLEYLVRHHAQVVSRETLARDIWKETSRTTPLDNVIDVHIARLRRKVDGEGLPKLIHTVRGVGFMLREGEP